ncbi:MAG: hypothetical protein H7327_07720 [Herminiimonas sp.]|nr:hypothetical protein [Herminiimonas sp.]
MENQDCHSLPAALARRLGLNADAAEIAEAVDAIWREIDARLFSILGQRGVAALYQRCLFITARRYPWLAGTFDGVQASMNLPILRSALLQQTPTNAAAASQALLHEFEDLLGSLVGPSLSERLLRSVCKNSSGGMSAQDTSS